MVVLQYCNDGGGGCDVTEVGVMVAAVLMVVLVVIVVVVVVVVVVGKG